MNRRDPDPDAATTILDSIVEGAEPTSEIRAEVGPFVGECRDDRHPSLTGRVQIAWPGLEGEEVLQWVPTLMTVTVRTGDRVLLVEPRNTGEPVVVGVLDGFARRPEAPESAAPSIDLRQDEVIAVHDARGAPLIEIRQADGGPRLRLLSPDLALEVPGNLRIESNGLQLRSRAGGVEIEADDDVHVRGEVVHLNGPRPGGAPRPPRGAPRPPGATDRPQGD